MYIFTLFVILMFVFYSCENYSAYSDEDCVNYDYSECNTTEPFIGVINVNVTINKQNRSVEVIVFDGDIEKHDTIAHDTVESPYFRTWVDLNKTYSAIAKYTVNNNSVVVVGSDKIKKTSSAVCDSVCWTIKGGNIDVRLKYDDI